MLALQSPYVCFLFLWQVMCSIIIALVIIIIYYFYSFIPFLVLLLLLLLFLLNIIIIYTPFETKLKICYIPVSQKTVGDREIVPFCLEGFGGRNHHDIVIRRWF